MEIRLTWAQSNPTMCTSAVLDPPGLHPCGFISHPKHPNLYCRSASTSPSPILTYLDYISGVASGIVHKGDLIYNYTA